ncbi:MAG: IS3 family transposase [Candidatus Marinimicrobia bacterium]|nr:IS3 family transposase [Candidatus Neomarinimicrobiota bacterium]
MMEEKRTRRVFTREFKVEAVELLVNGNRKAVEVARNLGIRVELLYRWKNEYMSNRGDAFPGMGHLADPEDERMRKLERELASVTEERDNLKKSVGHFLENTPMKYQFIDDCRSSFGVEKMCRSLAVSRSGFYRWNQSGESKRAAENRLLLDSIRRIYESTRGRYGSPRITAELKDQGYSCSRPPVARMMRKHDIRARAWRKFKVTTNSKHKHAVAPNLLRQTFLTEAPNRIWVSDITYIRTLAGWLYLTVVMDLYNRKIVGWSMSDRMEATDTTIPAFEMAVKGCQPLPGLVFHSDRGVQYACEPFVALLSRSKAIQSMSGRGNCYDNAVAESFFHTLKTELVYHEIYHTREQARRSLFEYMESFYNRSRKHSTLGYRSPVEYENMKFNQAI